jgi:predicted transcriptional regulator of viral defense system
MRTESVRESDIRTRRQTPAEEQMIGELANRQHGVVARDQLLRLGFEAGAIGRRKRAGRLHLLHPGVYSVGHRVLSRQGLWMAAVLASGPEGLLSHQTAAALWGIRGYSGGAIHVTVPHKSTSTKRIRRHFSIVPADERAVEEGVPVTSVHRTIFDLAATASADDVVAMIKEAEYMNRWDLLSLPDQALPGRLLLAAPAPDRRARRLGGTLQPLGLPRRSRP